MAEESSPNATDVQAVKDNRCSIDVESEDEDEWPEGTVYPLNSKKIVVEQLRRLERMLEVSSDGSLDTLRQLIEGS